MFKKVVFMAVCAAALSGCHTLDKGNYPHTHSDREFVNARVEMIQVAPEVCTKKFELTEDGSIAVGLLAGGLIGSGFGSGAGAALLTVAGAGTGAVVAHDNYIEGDKPSYVCKLNGYEAKITYFHPHTETPVTRWIALDRKLKTSKIRLPVSVLEPHAHKH